MYLFDYIYYRICKYYKMIGTDIPGFMSCTILSLIVWFTFLDIYIISCIVNKKELTELSKPIVVPCSMLILLLSLIRYKKKTHLYAAIRKSKNYSKLGKGFLDVVIVCYLLVVILTPMVIGYIKHNLGIKL